MARMQGTHVDHPVGDLAHAELCARTKVALFVLAWVRVVRMCVEPLL